MRDKIEQVLDEQVRPYLASHNGGVEFVDFRDGTVIIRLLGQCSNCPASYITTENLILAQLSAAIPEVERVVANHSVSEDLLAQAKSILSKRHENS